MGEFIFAQLYNVWLPFSNSLDVENNLCSSPQDVSVSHTQTIVISYCKFGMHHPHLSFAVKSVTRFDDMFWNAGINVDLCPWGPKMQGTANVASMFATPSCESNADPNLAYNPPTPLCHYCCFGEIATLQAAVAADWTDTGAFPHNVYGPIENWCFDPSLTDFSNLFQGNTLLSTEDLSAWVGFMLVSFEAVDSCA